MIVRDPAGAEGVSHDLIVVGGGIQGATVALEAVARGLRPLLLERADFGGETSGASLRILHGGLRYLQSGDLFRFRDSVAQRRSWLQRFPDLVRPLPCVLPLYGEGLFRPSVLRPTLLANDLLAADRNRGVREDCRLPGSRILSSREVLDRFPAVPGEGLKGGAMWYDASMERPHRLLMEVLRWAVSAGALALSRVEVTQVVVDKDRVRGVRAMDRVTGTEHMYDAPLVVNAAGPWVAGLVSEVAGPSGSSPLFAPSIAFNLLLDRPFEGEGALGIRVPRGARPTYFLRPWGRYTLVGTGHAPWSGTDSVPPRRTRDLPDELVEEFLMDLALALPGFGAEPSDVVRQLWGYLPAAGPGSMRLARRPVVQAQGTPGNPQGLVSLAPVKFTTAPGVAVDALNAAVRWSESRGEPAGRRGLLSREEFLANPPAPRRCPSLAEWEALAEGEPDRAAQVLRDLAAEEGAMDAEDLVLRRLDWGLEADDPAGCLERVRGILA